MQIICPKQLLLDNINIAMRAVTTRTTLPILECILIIADDTGVRLLSNDLEMGIETSLIGADDGVEITVPGAIALEAKMLAEIVRRLPDADVSLKTDNNNLTVIKCGKTEFKILGYSGEDFPYLPNVEKDLYISLKSETLKNAIRQTIFSVAVEESKPAFTGELFDIRPGVLNMVTVDGYRVSHRYMPIDAEFVHSAIIPAKTLSEISRILTNGDADVNIYFTDRQVLFETPECTVVSRLLEGEFIKYESVFATGHTTEVTLDRHEFLMALERAALISSREAKKNPVKLEIAPDRMILRSNTENGTSYEELSIELDGTEMEISFNPRYLIDAVKAIDENEVCIRFTAALSPCVMTGVGNTDVRFLVLPLRSMRT